MTLRVLVACEESQEVTKAFRALGHEAYSCDLQYCSGGHPDWHIMHDAIEVAYNGIWDLMIGHPPCTYLTYAGIGYFNVEKWGDKARLRTQKRDEAMIFFKKLWNAPINHICLENPRGFPMVEIKPRQMIHPYYFGDPDKKLTCLWLKNLPRLNGSIEYKEPKPISIQIRKPGGVNKAGQLKPRYFTDAKAKGSRERSKTFPGIAKAMAEQWSTHVTNQLVSKNILEKA